MDIPHNDFLTIKRLYDLSTYVSYKYRYQHIKTLLEQGLYCFQNCDNDLIYQIMIYHLTSDCDIRIIKLLTRYNVIGDIQFTDYNDVYIDLNSLDLGTLFRYNLNEENLEQLRFQIQFSKGLKDIRIYLDPDDDCCLSILNYAFYSINNMNVVKLLMEYGFEDYRTFNSNRRILRPLTCIECATLYRSPIELQLFIDYNDSNLLINVRDAIIIMFKYNKFTDMQLSCIQLLLNTIIVTSQDYKDLCTLWHDRYAISSDPLYKMMQQFIKN
jgi:hypothetical protein